MTDEPGFDLLVVEAFTWTPTLETACEVGLRYAAEGRRVGFVFLDVENVDQFPEMAGVAFGSLIYTAGRKTRRERVHAIEAILRSRGVTILGSPTAPQRARRVTCAQVGINSIKELREFRLDGAALGFGVVSTLVRLTGDSNPDFAENRDLADRILDSACQTYCVVSDLIERWRPREILLYNGRLAVSKAISEAARLSNVKVLHHEIASTQDRFYLSPDAVHSQKCSRRRLRDLWASAGEGREAIGEKYFLPRRGDIPLFETRPLGQHRRDQELESSGRWRIAYFTSSIDEYASIEDGFENPLFESQQAAAEWLASWAQQRPDTELVIRMHPRTFFISVRERNWWESLAAANVAVIPPDSPVDSYGLVASADRVVVHHSSIGAEATYMGRTSILVGDADYRGLDCVYEPETTEQLAEMLLDPRLGPKRKENVLPFGYQRLMRGERYRFYQPTSFDEGGFFGRRVPPHKEGPMLSGIAMRIFWKLKDRSGGRRARRIGGGRTGKMLNAR